MSVLQLAWQRFKIIMAIIGEIYGNTIVTVFYFTLLVPFGVGARLLTDPMRLRADTTPTWLDRPPVATDLEEAQRQG